MQVAVEKSRNDYRSLKKILPYVVLVMTSVITLSAIFILADWAEAAPWHHAAQHVMIFTSGAGAGATLLHMYKTRKDEKL